MLTQSLDHTVPVSGGPQQINLWGDKRAETEGQVSRGGQGTAGGAAGKEAEKLQEPSVLLCTAWTGAAQSGCWGPGVHAQRAKEKVWEQQPGWEALSLCRG